MANFTENRYPWPTEDHGGANAQTGGNTRLLFAEQDNYRTPKGFAGDATAAVDAVAATGTTASVGLSVNTEKTGLYSISVFEGEATTDPAGGTADVSFYYHTTDQRFKRYDGTNWVDFVRATSYTISSEILILFGDDDTAAYANAADAYEGTTYTGDIDSFIENATVIYFNSTTNRVESLYRYYAEVAAQITTTDVTSGVSGYIGPHADDAAANTASTGAASAAGDWYYDTTLNQFKYWATTAWVVMTLGTQIPGDNILIFESSSTHEYANLNRLTKAVYDGIQGDAGYLGDASVNRYAFLSDSNKAVNVRSYTAATAGTAAVAGVSGSGANDVFYVIPRVVSADIAETTENIPIEFLKGSLSANKAQAGAQTYGNGFSIAASEEGMHLFLRTLCNSRNDDIIVKTRNADSTVTPKRDTLPDSSVHVDGGSVITVSTAPVPFSADIVAPAVVQLIVDPTGIGADNVLELQIDGYDHEGEELREIMLLTAADNSTAKLTDFYFAQPPEGETTTYTANTAGGTGSAISINSIDRWTEVTFNQQDSVLLPGWTVEVRKGTIPFTYVGVSPNEASIALSRDTALQMDITTIAFDSLPYTDIEGNRVNLDDGKGSEGVDIDGEQGRGEIDFVDASETLFTGWQAYLDVTEPGTATPVRVPLTDATFSINHQLDQAQLIVGDRRPGPPFRSTLRDVMLDGTILFTRERDWVRLFRNNTDFKNPVVVLRNAPAGGFPYELHIELGLGQLMSSPDPQVSDLGLITQAFNMKFRETMSGMSDDFRFKIVTDKWIFETENNTVGGLRIDGIYAAPTS